MANKWFVIVICLVLSEICFGQTDTAEHSFYRVYVKILSVKCGVAACHDGSFEPDFRTLQSAYYTTVFQPVTKNNATASYQYRVSPFDAENSVLHQRVTNCCYVNDNDRMPLKGNTLTPYEVQMIDDWISDGAKDICGAIHSPPR